MALKDDILKAFEKNLTHDKVNQEGEIKTIKPAIGRGTPLDTLATDLSKAIVKWVEAQTFKVTKLEASTGAAMTAGGLTTPTGIPQPPGVPAVPSTIPPLKIPIITVTMNEHGQGAGNPKAGGRGESLTSEVKLKRAVEV